jgi:hypothetical protein
VCKLSKIWARQKLLPSQTEMRDICVIYSTNKCHRNERSSDVRCAFCGENHLANYKGCAVRKYLQKKTYPPLRLKQYTSVQINQILLTQPGVTRAQIIKQNSYIAANIEQDPCRNQPHQQTSDIKSKAIPATGLGGL